MRIAAVAYLVAGTSQDVGFIMGKAKVAPKSGHSIPRLELCGAVLGIEPGQCISEHLDIPPPSFQYFTDSKVVLGYIHNRTRRFYTEDIQALRRGRPVPKTSSILYLSPYLDERGLLRVGGRMNKLRKKVQLESVNQVIIPKCHVAKLLVRHFYERVFHQGRHFTEGSLRSNGYWRVGAKRLVSSEIGRCVVCRKLRGQFMHQKMADLPEERLTPGPPFTTVGVDVLDPGKL